MSRLAGSRRHPGPSEEKRITTSSCCDGMPFAERCREAGEVRGAKQAITAPAPQCFFGSAGLAVIGFNTVNAAGL
jgi:hypothetical protein